MKKTLAVAGIGAAITLSSLVGVGTASASTESFLRDMGTPFSTPAEQLAEGNSICAELSKGRAQDLTGPAAAAIITNYSNYNASKGRVGVYASKMISTAVTELCPINWDFLMVAARAYDAARGGQ